LNQGLQWLLRRMKNFLIILFLISTQFVLGQVAKTYLFVGTYTDGKPDNGIYIYEFNSVSGKLKKVATGKNLTNPSFLSLSLNGQFIYACTDTKMPNAGSVSAFKFDSVNGSLAFMNKQNSGGENPVYLTTSSNNEFIINANYTAGTVSVYSTNADGSLNPLSQLIIFSGSSINTRRQDKSHIHAAVFSPDYQYIFFPDLGSDKIHIYKFNPQEKKPLESLPNKVFTVTPGSGPRHFVFHPNQKFAYCIEELSGMVSVYKYSNSKLDSIQRIFSYSKVQEEFGSADIHISPDGKFLYASNRWEDENTISIFAIDSLVGNLILVGHQKTFGDHPRNFVIDPTGNFLIVANQVTNNLVVFKRNSKTGLLTKVGKSIKVMRPSCLQMRRYGG